MMNDSHKVKVRFPPSPTGFCHVGTARMALINNLFAKKHGGKIIFRSEDTDKARSTKEYEEDIIESLTWLGLGWDEFYRTTELVEHHKRALRKLIDEGKAYVSQEESKIEPGKNAEVVRMRNPNTTITFTDVIRGEITFDTQELGDFVIARAIDDPLYHLAVVVDDGDMGITHIIRGEEHISNTPRQILIQEALGYPRPVYAHYPLFLSADRAKLSKRKGDVAVREYRAKGYLPEALVNYMSVLGWTPPSGKEIMSMPEMIAEFELTDLHKSGAVFDVEKLRWFNRQYLIKLDEGLFDAEALSIMRTGLSSRGVAFDERIAHKVMPLVRERVSVWEDLSELVAAGEFDFFFVDPQLDASLVPGKNSSTAIARESLQHVHALFEAAGEDRCADYESVKSIIWEYATERGKAAVLWPLRYALSGKERSPDPFLIAATIGKDATLRRIAEALRLLPNET